MGHSEISAARLHLLGGFELEIDGETTVLQPALRRLLALVALSPRGVDRTFAAFQLWPDKCEERARANLRSALWRLRKLPEVVVDTTKTHIRLAESVWVDVREGIEALSGATNHSTPAPFGALSFDLLPDWYDDWLIIERERLRQLRLQALECRARTMLDAGETANAIQTGLAAVAVDPLRESAHRIVIEAHLSEGNPSEARRQLATYRHQLAGDPGLQPSAELERLFDQTFIGALAS